MTLEELQEEHLKLKKQLEKEQEEKMSYKTNMEKLKEDMEKEVKFLEERNDKLVEHNNNLFRQVTQPTKNEEVKSEKETYSIENLIEELGGN